MLKRKLRIVKTISLINDLDRSRHKNTPPLNQFYPALFFNTNIIVQE